MSTRSADAVHVAVRVRPLLGGERVNDARDVVKFPREKELQLGEDGRHRFTFDNVFAPSTQQSAVFDRCVAPLVDVFLKGMNATVFAYGQTGSGKTHTMGTSAGARTDADVDRGVVPRVIDAIFDYVNSSSDESDCAVRVTFLEVHKETLRDLLAPNDDEIPSIREGRGGELVVQGVGEHAVTSADECLSLLERGSLYRKTSSTKMNAHSSRSHAVFTVYLTQRATEEGEEDSFLTSKFHFVDLAGSERVKRTGAEGAQLKEGISINTGLLALGNCIAALSEKKAHVPFRDSKITRLLQDSLGGNARTLMIACISPADSNFDESLNALRYANRAKNIENRPIVNRDPNSAKLAELREHIKRLEAALKLKSPGHVFDVQEDTTMREENLQLRRQLTRLETDLKSTRAQRDACIEMLQQHNVPGVEDMLQKQETEVAHLRKENQRLRRDTMDQVAKMRMSNDALQLEAERLRGRLEQLDASVSGGDSTQLPNLSSLALTGQASDLFGDLYGNANISLLPQLDENEANEANNAARAHNDSDKVEDSNMHENDSDVDNENDDNDNENENENDNDERSGATEKERHDELEQLSRQMQQREREHSSAQRRLRAQVADLEHDLKAQLALVEQLLQTRNEMDRMKDAYDRRIVTLQNELREVEKQRDHVLGRTNDTEERASANKEFEQKISLLQNRIRTARAELKAQQKLVQLSRGFEVRLNTSRQHVHEMKKRQVQLLRQLRQEATAHRTWRQQMLRRKQGLERSLKKKERQIQLLQADQKRLLSQVQRKTEQLQKQRRKSVPTLAAAPSDGPPKCVKMVESEMERVLKRRKLRQRIQGLEKRLQKASRDKADIAAQVDDLRVRVKAAMQEEEKERLECELRNLEEFMDAIDEQMRHSRAQVVDCEKQLEQLRPRHPVTGRPLSETGVAVTPLLMSRVRKIADAVTTATILANRVVDLRVSLEDAHRKNERLHIELAAARADTEKAEHMIQVERRAQERAQLAQQHASLSDMRSLLSDRHSDNDSSNNTSNCNNDSDSDHGESDDNDDNDVLDQEVLSAGTPAQRIEAALRRARRQKQRVLSPARQGRTRRRRPADSSFIRSRPRSKSTSLADLSFVASPAPNGPRRRRPLSGGDVFERLHNDAIARQAQAKEAQDSFVATNLSFSADGVSHASSVSRLRISSLSEAPRSARRRARSDARPATSPPLVTVHSKRRFCDSLGVVEGSINGMRTEQKDDKEPPAKRRRSGGGGVVPLHHSAEDSS
ncbi:MAG: hypothetical protein MHM6MM_000801 [Cercozoa sp. M6MM]